MRCDQKPFTDPRVRQAIALSLDRPAITQALFKGYSDVGNDSPFAPVFPSTDTSVPQRAQDIAKAKSLLAAAGLPNGFTTPLVTENSLEIPQYAQIVVQQAAAIGVKINLKVAAAVGVLRQGDVRQPELAGRHDEPGRLRPPVGAERVPHLAAADEQRQDRHRHLERGALRQRRTTSWSRSTSPPATSRPRSRSRGRSRRCCWTRRRSSTATSTITCRPGPRTGPASTRPPSVTCSSTRPRSPMRDGRAYTRPSRPGGFRADILVTPRQSGARTSG